MLGIIDTSTVLCPRVENRNDRTSVDLMTTGPQQNALRQAAATFLDAAFEDMREMKILPRSRFEPWIRVGHQYTSQIVSNSGSYRELQTALNLFYPAKFDEGLPGKERSLPILPHMSILPLLEGSIANATLTSEPYSSQSSSVIKCINEFLELLNGTAPKKIYAWLVPHCFVASQVKIGLINSETYTDKRSTEKAILQKFPGVVLPEDYSYSFPEPQTLFYLEGNNTNFSEESSASYAQLYALVTSIRLATGATSQRILEINGYPSIVHLHPPYVYEHITSDAWLRRVGEITVDVARGIKAFMELMDDVQPTSSLAIAIARFNKSFEGAPWHTQLIDLSVALEASLGSSDTNEISLRLRSRASALLATSVDSEKQIYSDVKVMYGLRSNLVHGNELTSKKIEREIAKIPSSRSTLTPGLPGITVELMVDRCRDIVRRSIITRLVLNKNGFWLRKESFDVDSEIVQPAIREKWRTCCAEFINEIGLPDALSPPQPLELAHEEWRPKTA